uniref:Uncharacterized protein n=1 Tax=Parascaris univalens TaxID=6257 RepID=A0A915B0X7_PARUN
MATSTDWSHNVRPQLCASSSLVFNSVKATLIIYSHQHPIRNSFYLFVVAQSNITITIHILNP